jgi:hypothetical protein
MPPFEAYGSYTERRGVSKTERYSFIDNLGRLGLE